MTADTEPLQTNGFYTIFRSLKFDLQIKKVVREYSKPSIIELIYEHDYLFHRLSVVLIKYYILFLFINNSLNL